MATVSFEGRLMEILKSIPEVQQYVAKDRKGNRCITPGHYSPMKKPYPQITFGYVPGESHEIIPAQRATLTIHIWVANTDQQVYSKLIKIGDAIHKKIQRNIGAPFDRIDQQANIGIRVSRCQRMLDEKDYNSTHEKHFRAMIYDIVVSDNDDFSTEDKYGTWD